MAARVPDAEALWPSEVLSALPRRAIAVELAVGRRFEQAQALRDLRPDVRIIAVDLHNPGRNAAPPGVHFLPDDITDPLPGIYGGASLLYAVRLPEELQGPAAKLARAVRATLAFVPLKDELADLATTTAQATTATDGKRRTWRIIRAPS